MADDLEHTTHGTPGGLNVQVIAVVGIVSVLLVMVAVFSVQAWYYRFEQDLRERTEYRESPRNVERHRALQQQRLNVARYRDPERDLVAIPIDAAMDLYLEERLESTP